HTVLIAVLGEHPTVRCQAVPAAWLPDVLGSALEALAGGRGLSLGQSPQDGDQEDRVGRTRGEHAVVGVDRDIVVIADVDDTCSVHHSACQPIEVADVEGSYIAFCEGLL